MKIDVYKNKKPILVKFFQITALLIGSAFFTAQADFPAPNEKFFDSSRTEITDDSSHPLRAFIALDILTTWLPSPSDKSCFMAGEIHIFDHYGAYEDLYGIKFEVTLEFDNRKISINGDTSGSITYSGDDYPFPDSSVALFEIYANPPYEMVRTEPTDIKAYGRLNGDLLHNDQVNIKLPYYWHPYCQPI
ncbi:MAG: hypothetical protein V3U87_16225 [Methylococcaceae bacterium]